MIPAEIGALHVGIAMGAASMLSVGPNNLLLLKSGLSGNAAKVTTTILASYALLIVLAVLMAKSAVTLDEDTGTLLKWGGLAVLAHFSLQSFRSAIAKHEVPEAGEPGCLRVWTVLKTVWFNPLTYLELLLVPMSLAQTMSGDLDRVTFATALLFMSATCCVLYAFGGLLVSRVIEARRVLACFDLLSGTILACLSVSLASSLLGNQA